MRYTSVFRKTSESGSDRWHAEAAVRTKPQLKSSLEQPLSSRLFSPDLVPIADHPTVIARSSDHGRRLEAGRLEDYFCKTERVELEIVNPAILLLLADPSLPSQTHIDALKIYTDEGFHVVMLLELQQHLREAFDVPLGPRSTAPVSRITEAIARSPPESRALISICAAFVTETLITPTLRQACDDRLYAPIERFFRDHAEDEAKHHAFFVAVGREVLSNCVELQRCHIAETVPRIMVDFLDPNLESVCRDMVSMGYGSHEAVALIQEAYDPEELRRRMLTAARGTCNLFASAGINVEASFQERVRSYDFYDAFPPK